MKYDHHFESLLNKSQLIRWIDSCLNQFLYSNDISYNQLKNLTDFSIVITSLIRFYQELPNQYFLDLYELEFLNNILEMIILYYLNRSSNNMQEYFKDFLKHTQYINYLSLRLEASNFLDEAVTLLHDDLVLYGINFEIEIWESAINDQFIDELFLLFEELHNFLNSYYELSCLDDMEYEDMKDKMIFLTLNCKIQKCLNSGSCL